MTTKYEPLEVFLQNQPRNTKEVSMNFYEIEKMIGTSLPVSARTYRAWWANQKDFSNRSQAKAWLSAGFVVDSIQLVAGGSVTFRRN